jgi:hypothetical protein
MLGMSSTEWSSYMHDELGVPLFPEAISRGVVARMGVVRARCSAARPIDPEPMGSSSVRARERVGRRLPVPSVSP